MRNNIDGTTSAFSVETLRKTDKKWKQLCQWWLMLPLSMVTRLTTVLYLGVFTTLTFFLLSFRLPQQHMFLRKESSPPKPLSSSEASPNVPSSNSPERVQTILYYTPWWPDHASPKTWDLGEGSSPFAHCPQQSCYITANRSHLPSLAQFDALLFHSWNLFHKPGMTIPRVRSKNQRYILFSLEPASHCAYLTPWEEQVLSNFFNDTFTFRLLKFNFSCPVYFLPEGTQVSRAHMEESVVFPQ